MEFPHQRLTRLSSHDRAERRTPRRRQQADGVDLNAIATRLRGHGEVHANEFMLRTQVTDRNMKYEITLFPDGRAIVKGTDDPRVARSIYAKYVGT